MACCSGWQREAAQKRVSSLRLWAFVFFEVKEPRLSFNYVVEECLRCRATVEFADRGRMLP